MKQKIFEINDLTKQERCGIIEPVTLSEAIEMIRSHNERNASRDHRMEQSGSAGLIQPRDHVPLALRSRVRGCDRSRNGDNGLSGLAQT